MEKIKVFVMLGLFLGGAVCNIFAQYLDVGENPSRIISKNVLVLNVPVSQDESSRKFADWSPNGEFFAFKLYDKKKTIIFKKTGELFKEIDGLITIWLPDSQRILLEDPNNKMSIFNIINSGKVSITNTIWKVCDNPINGNIVFQDNLFHVAELDVNSLQVKTISTKFNDFTNNLQITKNKFLFYSNSGYLYKYNLITDSIDSICKGRLIKYFLLNGKEYVMIVSTGLSFKIFNENGIEIFNQNIIFQKGTQGLTSTIDDVYRIRNAAIAPNGKLISITRGLFDSEGYRKPSSADIWIINLKGKSNKLTDTANIVEIIEGWSPLGDKIIFKDANTNKYYLLEVGISD